MKHPILAMLAVVLSGCTYSPQHIERMAKSTAAVSELDALLDGFVSSYYRMPETMSELARYYKAIADSSVSPDQRHSLEAYLDSPKLYLSAYRDSCFIYDARNRIGCCYYGLPQTYLNAPWHSGFSLFHPSVISIDGTVLKGFEDRITEDLRAIWNHFSSEVYVRVVHQKSGLDTDISVKQVSEYFIPYRRLYVYSQSEGLVGFSSDGPDGISFFEVDHLTNHTKPLADNGIELSPALRQKLESYMNELLLSNPEIQKIYFFTYFWS